MALEEDGGEGRPGSMRRLFLVVKSFWDLPLAQRVVGAVLAAFVAFWVFIAGLVGLFDRVSATEGHSAGAWVVSLIGLVLSVAVGLVIGIAMLWLFKHLSRLANDSNWRYIASVLAATAGAILMLSIVLDRSTHQA
jgi:hypothetical protein